MPSAAQPPVSESSAPAINTKALLIKALTITALAIIAGFVCKMPPVKGWFDHAGPIANWFRSLGSLGIGVFIGASAGLILVGVPRLLLCLVAGVLYGFWLGLGVSLVSSMISYYVAFTWIRGRMHKGLTRTDLPKQLAFLAGDPGMTGVIISRSVPAPGMLVTTALALSNVKKRTYLIGSAIGLIPEAAPMVLAGALQIDVSKWLRSVGIAAVAIIAAWLIYHFLVRRRKLS